MDIQRIALDRIRHRMFSGKAILIFGPRQSGKTTLLRALLPDAAEALWLNGDLMAHHRLIEEPSPERFRLLLNGRKLLCIDEAQRIAD
ncbi:MAG: AAA family ATPase, partial [Flavobacteriales bacterium]|nr:AAA family ATPase [Flavobacteriales bacterium]